VRLLAGDKGEDFGKHIIPYAINRLNVKAFKFHGYWEDIGTIKAFFRANLALTDPLPEFDLYRRERPIYTRPRYLPPSKIFGCNIQGSMVCEGCVLESCDVEHSIIGIRSRIDTGASLNKVIMMGADHYQTSKEIDLDRSAGSPRVGIGAGSVIENAIIDKNARIGDRVRLVNLQKIQEGTFNNFEIHDGIIVVYKNAIIPSDTVF